MIMPLPIVPYQARLPLAEAVEGLVRMVVYGQTQLQYNVQGESISSAALMQSVAAVTSVALALVWVQSSPEQY